MESSGRSGAERVAGVARSPLRAMARAFLAPRFPAFAGLAGTLGWPILEKELRSGLRSLRFFLAHFACLSVLGGAVVIEMARLTAVTGATPTQVGQSIFNSFLTVQLLVVWWVFPAFSATAFTQERANQSLDLLLITSLRPSEIVWGKLLAASVYCFLYLVATVPLLAVSFLFAGVKVEDVLLAYGLLFSATLLVTGLGLAISSWCASGVRSSVLAYGTLSAVAALAMAQWTYMDSWDASGGSGATLLETLLSALAGGSPLGGLLVAFDAAALFCWLLVATVNRLRPSADDRSLGLRCLVLAYLPLRVFLGMAGDFHGVFDPNFTVTGYELASSVKGDLVFSALALLVVAIVFPCEEAEVSRRIMRSARRRRGWMAFLRLFSAGPFTGFLFAVLLAAAVSFLFSAFFDRTFAPHASVEFRYFTQQVLATLPLYIAAVASFGFLLAEARFTPVYARLTVLFSVVITTLLPVIFYVADTPDRLYCLYFLSPAVLWEALDRASGPAPLAGIGGPELVLWGVSIVTIGQGAFVLLTAANLQLGTWLARRQGLPLWDYGARTPRARRG